MGVFGKFKELIGIEEIDEEEDFEEEPVVEKKPEVRQNSFVQPAPVKEVKDNRVVNMQNTNTSSVNRITSQFKMVVIEPKGFDESPRLVDNLKAKKPVIINLEKLESDTARKIFDFLSGATYALNGNVQKIANNIFVFVPENVDVTSSVDQKPSVNFGEPKSPWR
ncbi:MAG: cell division protein SepF [Firmicutes bacterium]|jgi:cell division inhibitor SepF|nr:cell division protein SepF [Bacillota bacterium]MBQ5797740.1 cell division protein SepF [Bacillota bacterium]MBR6500363.1 cell division protein SepF [Bacillota bacterium]